MKRLKTALIKSLYFRGPQSTADLSKSIGKSIPNVTNILSHLIKDELILEKGLAASTGGRRAAHFSLNEKKHPKLICVACDQYFTQIATFDVFNNVISEVKTISNPLNENQASYERIVQLLNEKIELLDPKDHYIIGITMPGFVNYTKGINDSYSAENPLYDLKQNIQNLFKAPTFIENDSAAIAIAEQKFGKANGIDDALIINLNWGIGLGMIINNSLFRGHSGYASEFSHIPLSKNNDLCSCGKRGCLEVEASLFFAMKFIKNQLALGVQSCITHDNEKDEITFEKFLLALNIGDQLAIETTKKIAEMLGKGITTLIHIMNPEKIIISGRGAQIGNTLITYLQTAVLEFSIPRLSQHTKLEISIIDHPQLRGTAAIMIQQAEIIHFLSPAMLAQSPEVL